MRQRPCILTLSAAACLLAAAPAIAADPSIDAFEAGQQAAWNAHDAAAYTAAFDADADVVSALGWRWAGQADAARNLTDGFSFVYAHARLAVADVQVRSLTPDLASVTLGWSIEGARALATGQPAGVQHGFETQLLQRRDGRWSILAQQDTLAAAAPAPQPMPAAAAAAPAPPAGFPTTPPPVRRCILARSSGDCIIYGKAKPAS